MTVALIEMIAALALSTSLAAPPDTVEGVHFRVYRADGTAAEFSDIIEAGLTADVVLVGETHNDPIGHALEYSLLSSLAEGVNGQRAVVLSLEMFEQDVQLVIDEYLAGEISEPHFLRSSRPWSNYKSDYRPSVEYARENGLPVLAANAPRRYVNRVTRLGPESLAGLSESAKGFLPPVPWAPASEAYRARWEALMAESMASMPAPADSSANPHPAEGAMRYALDSQSLWDASMAYTITERLMDEPGSLVVHFVGSFHIATGTGLPEQIQRYRPATRTLIVTIRPTDSIDEFDEVEFSGLGDFVVLTDEAYTDDGSSGPGG
jgi:uncharacterized iron-regulated protein